MKQPVELFDFIKPVVGGVTVERTFIQQNPIKDGWRTKDTIITHKVSISVPRNSDAPLRTRYRKYEFYKGRLCFKSAYVPQDDSHLKGVPVRPLCK